MAPSISPSHLQWSSLSRRENGIVLPYAAQSRVFMISMIGPAGAATDAAKSLSVGMTLEARETSAYNRAVPFLEANFQPGSNGGADRELLRRTTKDPTSPIYDGNKLPGPYAYPPTPTHIN